MKSSDTETRSIVAGTKLIRLSERPTARPVPLHLTRTMQGLLELLDKRRTEIIYVFKGDNQNLFRPRFARSLHHRPGPVIGKILQTFTDFYY